MNNENTWHTSDDGEEFYELEATTYEKAVAEARKLNKGVYDYVFIGEQGEEIKLDLAVEDMIDRAIEETECGRKLQEIFTPKRQDLDILKDNIQKAFEQWLIDTSNRFNYFEIINVERVEL